MNNAYRCLGVAIVISAGLTLFGKTAETHSEKVVAQILGNVAKIKAADPAAVPMAFWDFDGTVIKGDVSEGVDLFTSTKPYKGLVERTIEDGLNSVYPPDGGWQQYFERDYPRLRDGIGKWLAWPYNAQMYVGQSAVALDSFCRKEYEKVYRKWYYASSVKMMRALEKAGVENYIVSASPEIFVRNACYTLGLPIERFRGIRVDIVGGYMTTRIIYPVPDGEGKVENVRDIVLARPHGVAVAAFGNSYNTDGAFLRYVATQPSLPGGAKGTALMINGGDSVPGYTEHFITAIQDEVQGDAK